MSFYWAFTLLAQASGEDRLGKKRKFDNYYEQTEKPWRDGLDLGGIKPGLDPFVSFATVLPDWGCQTMVAERLREQTRFAIAQIEPGGTIIDTRDGLSEL